MDKHEPIEFVVLQEKIPLVKENIKKIRSLFNVDVTLKANDQKSGQRWICLQGNDAELQRKAQTYIKSLCGTSQHLIEAPFGLCEKLRSGNLGMEVEKLTGAVLSFNDTTVYVQSDDSLVTVLAVSEIERHIANFKKEAKIGVASRKCDPAVVSDSAVNIPERSTSVATDIPPSMREFAYKLNYTDKEIDAVIKTFGTEININQLLQELVKNTASAQQLGTAPEDTTSLPGSVRGNCVAPPLQPTEMRRNLLARGPPASPPRRPEYHYVPEKTRLVPSDNLRPIVIDGSNVAMSHGNQRVFSCRGIQICVEYFQRRGHKDITVFVPMWRTEECSQDSPIMNQEVLHILFSQEILKLTPSRSNGNRRIVCYDDKYTVDLADQNGGIIVSNDNFRDLLEENPRWKETIEQRTLMYTFVGDRFMPPDDPLGRRGPSLNDFLRRGSATHPKICPYLKNCTFGNRCKYYHPERDTQRQHGGASIKISPEITEHQTNGTGELNITTQSPITLSTQRCNRNTLVLESRGSFQSQIDNHPGRPNDTLSRGISARGVPSHKNSYINSREGPLYPRGFYGGNVYADHHHPVIPDYAPPMYPPDMNQFPPLAAPWPSSPYSTPAHYAPSPPMGYPQGNPTYCYFEPPPPLKGNFQGQRHSGDQVDGNKENKSLSKEEIERLRAICDDENKLERILRDNPRERDINKLAHLLLEN